MRIQNLKVKINKRISRSSMTLGDERDERFKQIKET